MNKTNKALVAGVGLLVAAGAHAQSPADIYDFTSGPITAVTVTASEDYAPSAGQDIYGVFIFPTSLPVNGTVTFDTVPNFISIGTPDNFIFTDVESPQSSESFTTSNGLITSFVVNLQSPADQFSFQSSSTGGTLVVSATNGPTSQPGSYSAYAPQGSWAQPPALPAPYGCDHGGVSACEAIAGPSSDPSFNYDFYDPQTSLTAQAAPEIDPSGAAAALTLLLGGLALMRGTRRAAAPTT